ncbi:MAG: phenylacetate-CoA oxygenase/reductase subunit PaaK [Candidatus Eremiobacteraeota bacterium]|nr:phenylacetate-CoA oxygenase/reductase subunit PaaK [Candidatus Eremiobacteraeota bacterium]
MPQTRDAVAVTFDVPKELRERFRFAHGQYVTLRADVDGEDVRRSYSICSGANEGTLRVAIKRVADGLFSSWAHDALVPGAAIAVAPPEGRFTLALAPELTRHYLGIAAGSGITPLLSIIKTTLALEPHSRFTLVYGNRATSNMMFRDELQDLKDTYLERLSLTFVMSREGQDIDLFSGRIDRAKCDALFAAWIDLATVDVAFVCGPETMSQAVRESLLAHGMPPDGIKVELFVAAGTSARAARARPSEERSEEIAATVVLDGRERTFGIAKGNETVLDAGLRAGVELPYSCKGGVCATCRAVLVSGEVDMDRNFALEDYEVRRGFILTCQSYPVSNAVRVDYDRAAHALG